MSILAIQLDRLQAWLRQLPNAPVWSGIQLVEESNVAYGAQLRLTIPRKALLDPLAYAPRFQELLERGYSWIHLDGTGVFNGELLVTVQFPRDAVGCPPDQVAINVSGPGEPESWNLDGRVELTP